MPVTTKEYYSTTEAAKILGVVPMTVVRWIQNGHLKGGRIGNGKGSPYRIDKDSLREVYRDLNGKELDGNAHGGENVE